MHLSLVDLFSFHSFASSCSQLSEIVVILQWLLCFNLDFFCDTFSYIWLCRKRGILRHTSPWTVQVRIPYNKRQKWLRHLRYDCWQSVIKSHLFSFTLHFPWLLILLALAPIQCFARIMWGSTMTNPTLSRRWGVIWMERGSFCPAYIKISLIMSQPFWSLL